MVHHFKVLDRGSISGLYKTEVINQQGSWGKATQAEYATLTWVDSSNIRRLLGSFGHVPPAELEAAYYQQITGHAMPLTLRRNRKQRPKPQFL